MKVPSSDDISTCINYRRVSSHLKLSFIPIQCALGAQGFFLCNACGGGTASGLECLLLESSSVGYGKKPKLSFLSAGRDGGRFAGEHRLVRAFLAWVLGRLCDDGQRGYIELSTHINLNRLAIEVISSLTASLRFDGTVNLDVTECVYAASVIVQHFESRVHAKGLDVFGLLSVMEIRTLGSLRHAW